MNPQKPHEKYLVRPAQEADLAAIADFEVEIAKASFGNEAITDAAFHRRRVAGSLGKPGEITLVAVASDAVELPLGWAWMSSRTNSLTGARYGNFRSLAAADGADRGAVGELLMAAILRAAEEAGFTHLTGKVHAGNLGMRSLYRAFGFTATHLTMERRTGDAEEAPREPQGRGVAWSERPRGGSPDARAPEGTEERGTSDEGRRRLEAPRRRAGEAP